MKRCENCGSLLPQSGIRGYNAIHYNQKYCSDACKMKAYRRRLEPRTGTKQRRKEGAYEAWKTKQWVTKQVVCKCCSREFEITILHTNQEYCSNACKQKAYRQRKKERAQKLGNGN